MTHGDLEPHPVGCESVRCRRDLLGGAPHLLPAGSAGAWTVERSAARTAARSGAAPEKGTSQVGIQDVVPFFVGHAGQERVTGDTSIVHQDVESPTLFDELIDELIDGGAIRDVTWADLRRAAGGLDRPGRLGQHVEIPGHAGDVGTVGTQRLGDRLPQSARGSGNDRHLP